MILEGARWFYNLIGPQRFEPRFALFRSLEASGLLPPFARDNHPIEFGIYLCIEHPASLEYVPAGYLAWADQFCGLVHDFRRRHKKREWKHLRGNILSGLSVAEGGNHDSLNAVFFELRFGWLFGANSLIAPTAPGCELILGSSASVTADYVLSTPARSFSIDCKSLRNGPMRSKWDHHLSRALLASASLQRFLAGRDGVAWVTTPRLEFLREAVGAADIAKDIDDLLSGRPIGRRILVDGEYLPEAPRSPEAARGFISGKCPTGHSINLLTYHVAHDETGSLERPAYFACYTLDDPAAFACNVQRAAKKVLTKQAAPDAPAIVAFNADFITAMRADAGDPDGARREARAAAINHIQKAILEDEVCRRLYGVLFWFDPHLQSNEAWATDISIELLFWRNSHSPYSREAVPSLFDAVELLTRDPETG